jgi:UDP-N-acetyl-D-glucosamine/UDP-N-acetyl-D-galactosamine dehydrogenase
MTLKQFEDKEKIIAVIGLGYVGLPLALAFANKYKVIGFDINEQRVSLMKQGIDPSKELDISSFENKDIEFTSNPDDLKRAHVFIIGVPTDIDKNKTPVLTPLLSASKFVGAALKPADVVVYESTVYPGCTEEDCVPVLEKHSGLKALVDFKYGYSPERINPGDKSRTVVDILKIVSGCDQETLTLLAGLYGSIIKAGIYEAPSVKVAEAAKVIENTQRDLNISLMNELSIIFEKMNIDTKAVIEAASTKWNFIKLYPGLVGGHCIGVDPYYLIHKARNMGYEPQVIATGRQVNDEMPAWIAKRLVKQLIQKNKLLNQTKVLVMGITFKENVSDIRNSKVVDLIENLKEYSIKVDVYDPHADKNEVLHEYGIQLMDKPQTDYDAIIVAVAHDNFITLNQQYFTSLVKDDLTIVDLKSLYPAFKTSANYISL